MLNRWFLALAFTLAATSYAQAGPVVAAVGAVVSSIGAFAASSAVGAMIVKAAIGIALNVGISLIMRAMQPKQRQPGVQGQIAVGGDNPLSFILGWYATAGQLEYVNTGGEDGDTPNAYLTQVISLSDLPVNAIKSRLWVNGEPATIELNATPHAQYGYPVTEYRKDGSDYLWVKFYDGTQTTADSFLLSRFGTGSGSDRPWRNTMVGRGVAYAIVTARLNRNLFTGPPSLRFEVEGAKLYDPRKDSTKGGSGSHREDNPATWEYTTNPVVMIYNILRGIYYGDQWVYGLQGLPASRLPLGNWFAAMNACEASSGNDGFKAGLEVRCDTEPFAVIEALLDACNGRMCEVGGVYKIHVGEPGAAVFSFTDDDIVITDGQSYEPFPGLEATYNGIHASYPEPNEAWEAKDAPPRYDGDLEAQDDGRRLVADVEFPAVPYGPQVQRLMVAMLKEERRFRRHVVTLGPQAWLLEPLDIVSWTSESNGYSAKAFMVLSIDGAPGMNQVVTLKEVDHADYAWDNVEDELEFDTGPLGPIPTPVQPMVGWQVAPASIKDDAGNQRRPSIQVTFAGNMDDVEFVQVQVRLASTQEIVFDGNLPYGPPDVGTKAVILNAQFLPNTSYQVRGKFVPFSARETEWSEWLSVTTGNIRITDISAHLDSFAEDAYEAIQDLNREVDNLRTKLRLLAHAGAVTTGQVMEERSAAIQFRDAFAIAYQQLSASISEVDGELTAMAELLEAVEAVVGDLEAGVLWRMTAEAGSGDVVSRVVLQVRASIGDDWVTAGTVWEAGFVGGNPASPFARMRVNADQFIIASSTGEFVPFVVDGGVVYIDTARIRNIDATNIKVAGVETESLQLNAVTYPYFVSFGSWGPTNGNASTPVSTFLNGPVVDIDAGFILGAATIYRIDTLGTGGGFPRTEIGVWDVAAGAYLPKALAGKMDIIGANWVWGQIVSLPFIFKPSTPGQYRFDIFCALNTNSGNITLEIDSADIGVLHAMR